MTKNEVLNEFIGYMELHQQAYLFSLEDGHDKDWIESQRKINEATLTYVKKIAKKYLRVEGSLVSVKSEN